MAMSAPDGFAWQSSQTPGNGDMTSLNSRERTNDASALSKLDIN
jgi:hypothetical protein